ncbi:MAG: hypothetical protein ABI947_14200 [Chloroflexota bacterium]
MPSLLDKLNVLVKSSLNNFLDEAGNKLPVPRVPANRLGKDVDKEIAALRQQIDSALSAEDAMQQRLTEMQQQIDLHDRQIDAALQVNDDANARLLAQQMQHLQQQTTMAQSELEQHRRSTSDLIEHVNMLDSMVADAHHAQESSSAETLESPVESDQSPETALSSLLRDARQQVEDTVNAVIPPAETSQPQAQAVHIKIQTEADSIPPKPDNTIKVDEAKVDEDLTKRRTRLSKPD